LCRETCETLFKNDDELTGILFGVKCTITVSKCPTGGFHPPRMT